MAAAVIRNPFAGAHGPDLSPLFAAASGIGERLSAEELDRTRVTFKRYIPLPQDIAKQVAILPSVPLAELPGLVVPFKRPVYEAVTAHFAPLAEALAHGRLATGARA